jgi:hypothetical protein
VSLLRSSFSRQAGIQAARIAGALAWTATSGTISVLAYRFGPDEATLAVAKQGAGFVAIVSGALAALSIARPRKDRRAEDGIAALAAARGFSRDALGAAELAAWAELAGEAIFIPIAGISIVACAITAGNHIEGATSMLAGAALFGLVASTVIGAVAGMCRRWGGDQGRTWLLGIVFIPWTLAELLFRGAPYLSIPGLLGRLWESLTQVSS